MTTSLGPMRNVVGIREVRADGTVLPGAMSLDVTGGGATIEHVEASGGQPAKYLLTIPATDLSPLDAARWGGIRFTDWAAYAASISRIGVGNTFGHVILCTNRFTSTGARAYIVASGSETWKFKLHDANTGTLLQSANVTTSTTGLISVTWSQALTAGKTYRISLFNTTNSVYVSASMGTSYPAWGSGDGVHLNQWQMRTASCTGTGDVNPTTNGGDTFLIDLL